MTCSGCSPFGEIYFAFHPGASEPQSDPPAWSQAVFARELRLEELMSD